MELLLKEGKNYEDYTIPFRQHILPYFNLFEEEVKRLKNENQDREISEDIYSAESISDFVYKCGRYMQEPIRRLEYSYVLNQCLTNFKKNVLDVGCGISPLPRALSQKGVKVSGVDKGDEIIDYLNDKRTLLHDSNINYFTGNATDLNIPENSFDFVICVSVLEHLPSTDDTKAMKEMLRIVKPGGKLIITVDFTPEKAISYLEKQRTYQTKFDFSTLGQKTKSGLKLLLQRKVKQIQKKVFEKNVSSSAVGAYTLNKLYRQLIDPFNEYFFEEKPMKIELTLNDINKFYASTWFEGCMYKKNDFKENISVGFTLEKRI